METYRDKNNELIATIKNGSCNLGSINFNAFVREPFTDRAYFDYDRFEKVVMEMTWGLDELLTMLGDRHALQAQVQHVHDWREIGLGIMGLADLALSMKLGYGTPEFIAETHKIMSFMANKAAQASALRAKELGVFPRYSFDKVSKSRFYQEVYTEETKDMIENFGLRNSRLLSVAPTGSISNILGVSGGVEPFFMLSYNRTIKSMFETERTIEVVEKTPAKLMKEMGVEHTSELPEWAKVTSQNIDFQDRAIVQSTIQKYVDTAISSTFNLHNSATTKDVENIYTTGWGLGFKGATVFRDNCKKIGILTGGGESFDKNPAPKPGFEIQEEWFNKKTKEMKRYITYITVDDTDYVAEKIEREMCPVCGEHLVKQGGCTKCSSPECYYEKCAI
jgi:ribonucleoside-diphosphate reductase alpha chain